MPKETTPKQPSMFDESGGIDQELARKIATQNTEKELREKAEEARKKNGENPHRLEEAREEARERRHQHSP